MENDLVKSVRRAVSLLDKLYEESDHLHWTYLRYANITDKLNTNNKKAIYIAVLTALLLSVLVSNLRLFMGFSLRVWLSLLAAIWIGAVCIWLYSSTAGKKKTTEEYIVAKEDYEKVVKPFMDQIDASADLKRIPPRYQYPIAAKYILEQLRNGTQTVDEAVQKYEEHFDDMAGWSDHEEFRNTKEQEQSVRMFYPDAEIPERYERKSSVVNRDK